MIRVEVDSANALGLQENLDPLIPKEFSLNQNYPNPFNPTTTIDFALATEGNVSLMVYDVMGRVVDNLVDKNLNSGFYSFGMNGVNLSSGMYFYRLTVTNSNSVSIFSETKKLVLMK